MQDTYNYPLLDKISILFKSQKNSFQDVYILACQHILSPQAKMFELIHTIGVPKENIFIFGKAYSTSPEVLVTLKEKGFKVSDIVFNPDISFDEEHTQNCKDELDLFLASIKKPSKIIILDDGGQLLKTVNDSFESLPDIAVIGIEQTSSGFRKLENTILKFPVFNVARSSVKLEKESPLIATLGCSRIDDVIAKYSILEPRILVVGLGPIGSSLLSILNNKKYFTAGYDTSHHEQVNILNLIKDNNINIVVGATGSNILTPMEIDEIKNKIHHPLYLISISSADREFPTLYIRSKGIHINEIHSDVIWGDIILINNGFPITFKGKIYESTPQEIERTIALLYGSTLEAISTTIDTKGFIETPKYLNEIL